MNRCMWSIRESPNVERAWAKEVSTEHKSQTNNWTGESSAKGELDEKIDVELMFV